MRLVGPDGKQTDREYRTTVHCMEKTEAFTIIIERWPNPRPDLFDGAYCYHAIATNDYERETKDIIWFHNGRGNAENNKELKSSFGMGYFPCQSLRANAVWLGLGVLAHNLAVVVKRLLLGGDWVTKTIATFRWQLVFIAGKVVPHGQELWLQVRTCYHELLKLIHDRLRLVFAPT
ncbi:MAG: transposase [candidate division WOR-3 bacterium]